MGYLVQARFDGQWHPVGDPLGDITEAVAVRGRLASGGIWSNSRIVVLDEDGMISEVIDDSESAEAEGA